ncbi:MAG: response regulator [Burkholderiales bacterium]|nr:response regulator [Burkholderiales bacterium]
MGKADSPEASKAVDLDFTGVFKVADLKIEPPPPPPRRIPQDILIGARSLAEDNYFVNLARPRAKRSVDPAKTTILIVEDDLPTLNMLDLLLTRAAGYQTRRAHDVQTFVQAMQKMPLVDAVLLDLSLPGKVSGFKILAKIRSHPSIRNLPVIILSGHSSPEYLLQGLSLGADAYLSKPAKSSAVFEALKAVLGG